MHNYKPTKRLNKYKAFQDFFNQCTMGYYSVNPMESFLQLEKVKPKGFTESRHNADIQNCPVREGC